MRRHEKIRFSIVRKPRSERLHVRLSTRSGHDRAATRATSWRVNYTQFTMLCIDSQNEFRERFYEVQSLELTASLPPLPTPPSLPLPLPPRLLCA